MINILEWPSQSPDRNPIEILCKKQYYSTLHTSRCSNLAKVESACKQNVFFKDILVTGCACFCNQVIRICFLLFVFVLVFFSSKDVFLLEFLLVTIPQYK